MLVITRKKGESLMIGDDIEISVVKVEDGIVKIAINAPKDIRILRKELYTEVQEENRNATEFNMDIIKGFKK
jgi:carbon storage regulator